MNQPTQSLLDSLRRPLYFLVAIAILWGASSGVAFASAVGGQTQYRSIKMSDSGVSGGTITSGIGSGTNVTYRVTFRAATSYTMKALVLDFCKGSAGTPIVGDSSCTAPTSFTVGATPTIDTTTFGGITGLSGTWTPTSINSGQTFEMDNSTGTALTSGTDYTFAISGITNPSDAGTFYARLITYTAIAGSYSSYAHGTPGTYQDFGGFALTVTEVVQVTAKVQETLTFCMLGTTTPPTLTAPTDCSDGSATAPSITLGHGTNNVLDTTTVDTNGVYSFASTNALHGIAVRVHINNACGGMSTDGGTTCDIPPTNAGAATTPTSSGQAIVAGTAAFGMAVSSGSGVSASAPYTGSTASSYYGFDTTTSGANATTTYGSTVLTSTGPMSNVMNTWSFAAAVSNTTPAGLYSANLSAIATSTF